MNKLKLPVLYFSLILCLTGWGGATPMGKEEAELFKSKLEQTWIKRISNIKTVNAETHVINTSFAKTGPHPDPSLYQLNYAQDKERYRLDLIDVGGKSPVFLIRQSYNGEHHQDWSPAEGGFLQVSTKKPFEKFSPLFQDGTVKAFAFLKPNQVNPPDVFAGILWDDFLDAARWKDRIKNIQTCETLIWENRECIKVVFDYMDYQDEGSLAIGPVLMEVYFSNDTWLFPIYSRLVGADGRLYADFTVKEMAEGLLPYPKKAVSRHFETRDQLTYTLDFNVARFLVNEPEPDEAIYSIDVSYAVLIFDRDNRKTIRVPK